MKRTFVLSCLTIFSALAQPGISPPRAGFIQDTNGALRSVFGVSGNLTLGDAGRAITSAGFAGRFGFFKTDSSISIFDSDGSVIFSSEAPSGSATYAFSGSQGFVLFTDAQRLWHWDGSGFADIAIDWDAVAGQALSVAQPDQDHIVLAVRRDDGQLWTVLCSFSGEIQSQKAIGDAPDSVLALNDGGFVLSKTGSIVFRSADGTETSFELEAASGAAPQHMAAGWIQVQNRALRLKSTGPVLYFLPEANQ